ncbi:MAG: hypothetical protein DMF91_25005 [Acidobacteria bacterium]|nr:MAG: hypothetical protein DMF91_25005 [Acidobacteriota bacterium]
MNTAPTFLHKKFEDLREAGATSLNAAAFLMSFDSCRMHHWTRERIAAWVADPDVPQDESHAHH